MTIEAEVIVITINLKAKMASNMQYPTNTSIKMISSLIIITIIVRIDQSQSHS